MQAFVQETTALSKRWFLRFRREPFNVAFSLMQPVLWLLLFSSLFENLVTPTADGADYRTFMTPGVIVMTIVSSTLMAGIPLLFDKEMGVLTKLLSTPIARSSIIVSHFFYVNTITLGQTLLILGMAVLLGVSIATGVAGVLFLLAVGMALGAGITMISMALAFRLHSHGEFFAITGFLSLPLIFVSSALAPLSAMPGWLRLLAHLNPMTYAIDGVRTLVIAGWQWGLLLKVIPFLLLFDAVAFVIGLRTLHRHLATV